MAKKPRLMGAPGRDPHTSNGEHVAPAGPINVIVPVYNAVGDLARCIESVLAHTAADHRLVLIDDASPDPAIPVYLAALARRRLPHVTLLANDQNLGFTGTANRGMALSSNDIVLLNSDTVVTAGWLEALQRCAASDARIGTITPFSNNAEICSYPRFCQDNPWPEEVDPEPRRAALARAAIPTYPDLPTGVGFCFFIRRALIDSIGTFDPAFGRGYGEENDLCLRAARAGWRNVLCDDAFVLHLGGRSFAGDKAELGARNLPLVLSRHPHYLDLVRDYINADPLRAIRGAAIATERAHAGDAPGVLHVIHGHGGGTEHHVRSLIEASRERCRHYLAIAVGERWQVEEHTEDASIRVFEFSRGPGERWDEFIGGIAATFAISLVHLHHLSMGREGILAALSSLSLPYGITIHDLWLACPTVTLTGPDGRYCGGETDLDLCRRCLGGQPALAAVDIAAWREQHAVLLQGARFVIAPSRWAAAMLARYFPATTATVIPHATPGAWAVQASPADSDVAPRSASSAALALPDDDIPTVAIVGAIGPDKGARRLERLVDGVRSRAAPFRFVVIGYLDVQQGPWQSDDRVVTVHGRYDTRDLPVLLADYRVALVAYPSAGPESFSLTLSEVWAEGCAALVPPIGALAERVSASGGGFVWSVEEWASEERMLDRILTVLAERDVLAAAGRRARAIPQRAPEAMAASTLARYAEALAYAQPCAFPPLANERVRNALGYVPWVPPTLLESAKDATSQTPAVVGDADGFATALARFALRWRHTSVGRVLYRMTPALLLDVLKDRLR